MSAAAQFEPDAFPRVGAYLRSLPDGIDSYPACVSKAAIQRTLLERLPIELAPGSLPQPAMRFIEDPPLPSAWVPTVVGNVIELAVADQHCPVDEDFVTAALEMNLALFSSPMYRVLVHVMSPGFLLKQASKAWARFHRGSELRAVFEGKSASLMLSFPPQLHPGLVLLEKGSAFRAALEAANGRDVRVEVDSLGPEHANFDARWR